MKYTFLFLMMLTGLAYGQSVEFLNKTKVQQINFDEVLYVNASDQKESEWSPDKNVFVDFQVRDAQSKVDRMVVEIDKQTFESDRVGPVLLKDLPGGSIVNIRTYLNGEEQGFVSNGGKKITVKFHKKTKPSVVKDTIVFGLLAVLLAAIFYTSSMKHNGVQKFYRIIPALLLCYVLPALLNTLGIISNEYSELYTMSKNYLLPGALVLMTLGIDFKGLFNLGPKAIIMFLTATVGIIIGGPIAILIFKSIDPSIVGGVDNDATWRGLATLAGSWIGGGANQAAMLETYEYNQALYGKMVTVDIVVANIWMAFLLWGATRAEKFDKWLKADSSDIEDLKQRTVNYQLSINRQANLSDYMIILGIAFGAVGLAHMFGGSLANYFGDLINPDSPFASSFFWIVVIATSAGLIMSMTKLRNYEGAGASKVGSVFIYILVASIGMNMELEEAVKEPVLILVGITWMLVHVGLLFLVAKIIKAPFFFVAVGSKANVGGAASAPVVAAAFHPSLASVGAILAVLGYALGTYGALLCAEMMHAVAP